MTAAPTWAVLLLTLGVGALLLTAVVLPALAGPLGLVGSAVALIAAGTGLRIAAHHPVDPRRDRQPDRPDDRERGRRDAETTTTPEEER